MNVCVCTSVASQRIGTARVSKVKCNAGVSRSVINALSARAPCRASNSDTCMLVAHRARRLYLAHEFLVCTLVREFIAAIILLLYTSARAACIHLSATRAPDLVFVMCAHNVVCMQHAAAHRREVE